ncbi:hypothetical protein SDC9_197356 [bioreactor metagenome]|uniref:Orn/Lys/Arg decarboxylase C-terminal domain-containing protein n=1 Tax=bioreactor metagenome TaxID=1076179 RepID=A0A645IN30_9ZZZZ
MRILREQYGIELEMAYNHYALAMTGLFDSEKNLSRLANALIEIDRLCQKGRNSSPKMTVMQHESNYSVSQAVKFPYKVVCISEAIGKVSAEYIWAYPPGIPYIVPGEKISEAVLTEIRYAEEKGAQIISDYSDAQLTIAIIK